MMIVVNDERISKLEKGDQLDKLLGLTSNLVTLL